MSKSGRFTCKHCGARFNLPPDEMKDFEEGYYAYEPDTCDDCMNMVSSPQDYPEHSDADPGL